MLYRYENVYKINMDIDHFKIQNVSDIRQSVLKILSMTRQDNRISFHKTRNENQFYHVVITLYTIIK